MKSSFVLLVWFILLLPVLNAQKLESIVPITRTHGHFPDSVSLVFAATDYNFFVDMPATFTTSLQVVDANNPWPPRWFMPATFDSSLRFTALLPLNASIQENKLSYFTAFKHNTPGLKQTARVAYVICNEDAEPVDTFYGDKEVDSHEFRISPNGEKIYFDAVDERLNIKDITGFDSVVKVKYENIVICNSGDTAVFYWNTLQHLGMKSVYPPYTDYKRYLQMNKTFDWPVGNSVCFSYDGNILYSFKNIGIGKISRYDSHIMWRIDRNNMKPNALSDSVLLFLQHDFKSVKDAQGNIIYTLLSNGDSLNPGCMAVEFTEHNSADGTPVFKIVKKIKAPDNIRMTTAGNFDVEPDNNYLLNYGVYNSDTAKEHVFFEYRNGHDSLLAAYSVSSHCFYYRVHKTGSWGPKRPEVIEKDGALKCAHGQSGTWYKMDGKNLESLKPLGKSSVFRPKETGYYCVAVASGIGYAVSKPIQYAK